VSIADSTRSAPAYRGMGLNGSGGSGRAMVPCLRCGPESCASAFSPKSPAGLQAGGGGPDAVSRSQSPTVSMALSRWSQMTAWRPEVLTVRPNGCSATVLFDPGHPASLNSSLSSLRHLEIPAGCTLGLPVFSGRIVFRWVWAA
jgi:hypothetical protein